ncbi:MAG: hypothetical protein CMJ31_05345 [Phycisphaerae bacterium]|nr:hypothetical protein [Phycisphaerae bacterium]
MPKSKRSGKRRFLLKSLAILFAVCVVAAIAIGAKLFAVSQRTAWPTIDYIELANRDAIALAESDRAWPLYQTALNAMGEIDKELLDVVIRNRREAPDRSNAIELVRSNTLALQSASDAGDRPAMGYLAVGASPRGMAAPFPWFLSARFDRFDDIINLARLQAADALLAAVEGDAKRASQRLIDALRLADRTADIPETLGQLLRNAIGAMTVKAILSILTLQPDLLDDAFLARIDAALAEMATHSADRFLRFDRYSVDDLLQRTFTNDGDGSGQMTLAGMRYLAGFADGQAPIPTDRVLGGALVALASDRAEIQRLVDEAFEEAIAIASSDYSDAAPPALVVERIQMESVGFPPDAGRVLIGAVLPPVTKAARSLPLWAHYHMAATAAIAIHRHRLRAGEWPASLAAIDASLLARTPRDLYSGDTLHYQVSEDGPLLYSVGVDGDDDRGRHAPKAHQWRPLDERPIRVAARPDLFDGDWVFLPAPPTEDDDFD